MKGVKIDANGVIAGFSWASQWPNMLTVHSSISLIIVLVFMHVNFLWLAGFSLAV